MLGYTAAQVRAAEEALLSAGEPLMQRAARDLATAAAEMVGPQGGSILILVGSGNNGADGLYAGMHLAERGYRVQVLPVGARIHGEALRAALTSGAVLLAEPGAGVAELVREVLATRPALIIDAILGTGSAGSARLREPAKSVVESLNQERRGGRSFRVLACDLPSGLDPDTGEASENSVLSAQTTVTFGGAKVGLLKGSGPDLSGVLRVADIGMGSTLAKIAAADRKMWGPAF